MVGVSKKTVTDWCNFFSGVCSNALLSIDSEEYKLGGPGKIVEIDETLISKKQKYHRGRAYPEVWLFMIVERGSNKWHAEVLPDRKRETLVPLIKKFIRPGTTIYSDQWKGYFSENFNLSHLEGFDFTHLTVNHNLNFKDPLTHVHTNTVEGLNGNIKNDLRKRRGLKFTFKINFIEFKMWLSRQVIEDNTPLLVCFWKAVSIFS